MLNTYTVTYWTNDSKTVRAHSIENAGKALGYSLPYQKKFAWTDEETGEMHLINIHGDHCATIKKD